MNMSTVYNGPSVEEKLNDKASVILVRIENYQYILKGKVLTITEQMEGLELLQEKLDALEKLYIVISKEQRGRAGSPFDHNREVGMLIYKCGMRMGELKEQAEEKRLGPPTCEAPPPPSPHPTPPSVPSKDGTWRLPQIHVVSQRCRLTPTASTSPLHQGVSRSLASLPVHVSPSNRTGTSSGVRGHKVARERRRSSRSVDVQSCLNIFLNDNT